MLVLLINAPLRRRAPRLAVSSAELAVILGMMLVACALPSSGLMRYLPTCLNNIWYHSGGSADYANLLDQLNLPGWMFPRFATSAKSAADRANDPVIQHFYWRVPVGSDRFIDRFFAVPWIAWLTPIFTWGIFIAALYGALLCLSTIVRRQWTENERLSFPLAQVWQSLIEEPSPNRALNSLLRSVGFWFAFALIFLIHFTNGLAQYFPKYVPEIPLKYDLTGILTFEPWRNLSPEIKSQTIYFSIVGIMFFVQTRISFSLWFFYLAFQLVLMMLSSRDVTATLPMQTDQLCGGALAFAIVMLWVGRSHWATVIRQMFIRARADEPRGKYLSHFAAGWGVVACMVVMILWLTLAGMTAIGAIVLVLIVLTLIMLVARIIAETGLHFAQLDLPTSRPRL
jgi:hypothetical protein